MQEQRERHRKFREEEGRPLPTPPEGGENAGTAAVAGAAGSSTEVKRSTVVLTPAAQAAQARGNSFPPIYKLRPRIPKSKRDEKKGTDDPLYEVSLGTESDDFSGHEPDPDWWNQTPRSERKRERDAQAFRSTTASRRKGRSPPPGFSWKDWQLPQGKPKPKRSRVASNASRKRSADKRKHSAGKKAA